MVFWAKSLAKIVGFHEVINFMGGLTIPNLQIKGKVTFRSLRYFTDHDYNVHQGQAKPSPYPDPWYSLLFYKFSY